MKNLIKKTKSKKKPTCTQGVEPGTGTECPVGFVNCYERGPAPNCLDTERCTNSPSTETQCIARLGDYTPCIPYSNADRRTCPAGYSECKLVSTTSTSTSNSDLCTRECAAFVNDTVRSFGECVWQDTNDISGTTYCF